MVPLKSLLSKEEEKKKGKKKLAKGLEDKEGQWIEDEEMLG